MNREMNSNLVTRHFVSGRFIVRYFPVFLLTLFSVFSLFTEQAQAQRTDSGVWLGAKRVESTLMEVAVPDFRVIGKDTERLGEMSSRLINFDLQFTGMFKVNRNFDFMRKADLRDRKLGRVNYKEWRTLASNFLIKGEITELPDDRLSVEIVAHDLQTKKEFFAKRLTGGKSVVRRMIHRFSDAFVRRLTGEKGVADTRIGLVSRVRGRKELFLVDYDGANPQQITDDRSLVLFPHMHPELNKALFTTYRYRNPDLYVLDLDTNTRKPISRKIGLNSTGEWSRDGSKIVFSLSIRGNSEIYTCNADGSGLVRLTNSYAIETSPTFSPDGKFIAFTSDRPGAPQIYLMKSSGGGKRRLTYVGRYNDGPSWSPRGDYITYASLIDKGFDIALLEANNIEDKRRREVRQLTQGTGSNEAPSFSPNGRNVAFMSSRGGTKQIYIVNVDGGNLTRITNLPGGGYLPSWGPSR